MDHKQFSIFDCGIIRLPKIEDRAGNTTPVENSIDIPFAVNRVYYIYDIPGGASRGAHAHKSLEQVIIAASGSFDVTLDDGRSKKTFQLSRPYYGLHIVSGIWRDISNYSSSSICLTLASELYDPSDYIRDYDDFIAYKAS